MQEYNAIARNIIMPNISRRTARLPMPRVRFEFRLLSEVWDMAAGKPRMTVTMIVF